MNTNTAAAAATTTATNNDTTTTTNHNTTNTNYNIVWYIIESCITSYRRLSECTMLQYIIAWYNYYDSSDHCTPTLPTNIVGFRGFDSSTILIKGVELSCP